jgi:hypothetical protein
MSLLLPDHDTKRDCVFKIGGRDPNASGARAPRHSDPLHPVPGDGGWFRRGPSGSFRLDEPRPSLHSHWVGTATLRWLADAHLEVRRRLVNSLLERLRRRLRELGRPLHEEPSSDGRQPSSRAPADDAPQCRTEIELSQGSRNADRTGSGEPTRLPAQQPPPPKSTRLKAAVFSKKRHPTPQRQAGSIWGPTSFLDVGIGRTGGDKTDRSPLFMFEVSPVATVAESSTNVAQWPGQPLPATLPSLGLGAGVAHLPSWTAEQTQAKAAGYPGTSPPWDGASPLEGVPSFDSGWEPRQEPAEVAALTSSLGSVSPLTSSTLCSG